MKKSLIFTVLATVALLALGSVSSRTAEAQQFFDKLTVVAIDRYAISSATLMINWSIPFWDCFAISRRTNLLCSCLRTI